jgi:putative sigma-54 modulation protein
MKFEYTGRHIEVTPALRAHVESHFEKLAHLFDENGDGRSAHVIIESGERGRHRSEIIVQWHDQTLTAETTVPDMYKSLSQTIDKIEKQALKLKNKIKDKHQKAKKVASIIPPAADVSPAEPDGASQPQIVVSTNYPVKPMTAEEAVLSLQAEKNQFIVFRNADTERVSVLYKRDDGDFGLIEP